MVSTAKTSDLIIVMLDATKSAEQRRLLEIELDAVGIRLNKTKPDGMWLKSYLEPKLTHNSGVQAESSGRGKATSRGKVRTNLCIQVTVRA